MTTTKVELDTNDFKLIFQSICYFDHYNDGEYDKWFGSDHGKVNESFEYLYSLCREHLDNN